jgi:hypothetical protein
MALFNLSDISYTKEERKFPPLSALFSADRSKTTQLLKMRRYPIDLGSTDRGHYMLIHINVQEKSSYKAEFSPDLPTIQRNRAGLQAATGATNAGGNANLLVDNVQRVGEFVGEAIPNNVKNATSDLFNKATTQVSSFLTEKIKPNFTDESLAYAEYAGQVAALLGEGVTTGLKAQVGALNNQNFLRRIKRTTETIALYMPGTMAYTHNQAYSGDSFKTGGEPAAFYGAGMSLITDAINGKVSPSQLGENLTPFIAEKLKNLASPFLGTNSATGLFASAIGGVQNPQLELIYNSPSFRNFRFDFMFYPSSEREALEVQHIIQALKFHQAPEIMRGTAGYFMVPPSEFDIEFCYNGEVNPNIPKISTCVLTSIDMDYAPKGFVAYEIPDESKPSWGKTGMPFAIRLSLSFQETEIMTKYNFTDPVTGNYQLK